MNQKGENFSFSCLLSMIASIESKSFEFQQKKDNILNEIGSLSMPEYFDYCCSLHPTSKVSSVDSGISYSFKELCNFSNQIFNGLKHLIFGKHNYVLTVLLMENSPEFIAFEMGLSKLGLPVALLNVNVPNQIMELYKLLTQSKDKVLLVQSIKFSTILSNENIDCWLFDSSSFSLIPSINCASSTSISLRECSKVWKPQVESIKPINETALLIFTSGTSGPSKAAMFSHRRFVGAGVCWSLASKLSNESVFYSTLPLYHGNSGAIALSSALLSGSDFVIREKFSVSKFWVDVKTYKATAMIYIGELWRYLISSHKNNTPFKSSLTTVIGNGLCNKDYWTFLRNQFGIENIIEHYGSTEMPGDALINFYGIDGCCGYERGRENIKLVHPETLIEVDSDNGVGELLIKTTDGYLGYWNDPMKTQKKLIRNLFAEGDVWYRTGDLLRVENGNFYYFIDRLGDTFRWKGENVSCADVKAALERYDLLFSKSVKEIYVYPVQVPFCDGKAGMAYLTIQQHSFDIKSLSAFLVENLAPYAIPLFLKIETKDSFRLHCLKSMTSTLKQVKRNFISEGFDPSKIAPDQNIKIYFWNRSSGIYSLLYIDDYNLILQGKIKL